jgi:citrate synthase
MSTESWNTAVTKIEPNKILVRGYRVDELMGNVSYPQMVYLLIKGELPSEKVGRIIDAILVSSVDHGVTPPSCQAAVTVASTGATLNAAIASGILAINRFHGGAIEQCMQTLLTAVELKRAEKTSASETARKLVTQYRDEKKKIMGYGHRVHSNDPRTARLFDLAKELGLAGEFVEMSQEIQNALLQVSGKNLPINVDGAIAAVLCEIDLPAEMANAFFIMARLPGLLAHIYEEKIRYKPMRRIDFAKAVYDGPDEKTLK